MDTAPQQAHAFEMIFHPDGTCTHWDCGKQGVVLAFDSFSPEFAHWFCASCWQEYEDDGIPFLDIVEDRRERARYEQLSITIDR